MSIQSEINRIAGAKSDIADAIEDKGVTVPSGTKLDGMANLIGQISGGSEKLNSTQAADAYDPTATYAVGDKVSYAGNVYSCISAISTPEGWDSTHWDQVDPIQDQVDDVRNTLNSKAEQSDLALIRTGATNTGAQIENGTYFYLDGTLKQAIATIAQNASFTAQNCTTVTAGGLNELRSVVNATYVYDANTARAVEANRVAAMEYILQNYFIPKASITATIRYSEGYYFSYLYFGHVRLKDHIVEFTYPDAYGVSEKIIFWERDGNDSSNIIWKKAFSI